MWEVVVGNVDIGSIYGHQCLNIIFIFIKIVETYKLVGKERHPMSHLPINIKHVYILQTKKTKRQKKDSSFIQIYLKVKSPW